MRKSEKEFTKALHRFTVQLAILGSQGLFDPKSYRFSGFPVATLCEELALLFKATNDFLPGELVSIHVDQGKRRYSLRDGELCLERGPGLRIVSDSAANRHQLLEDLPEIVNTLWLITVGHVEVEVGGSIPAPAGG